MPVKRRGGRRPGAGRPRSRVRALTREIANRCAEEGITPLEFMLRVMRDESADLQTRADMAKSAAPYIHPRLQAVEHAGWDGGPIKGEMKFSVSFEGEDDDDDLDSAWCCSTARRGVDDFFEDRSNLSAQRSARRMTVSVRGVSERARCLFRSAASPKPLH